MNSATNLKRGRSTAAQRAAGTFSLRETKELIQDLFAPRPSLYWTDFLITVFVAYGVLALVGLTLVLFPMGPLTRDDTLQ